jgi:hypothetical protein
MTSMDACATHETLWPTEFLERRELQLIVEAGAYPVNSPENKRLVHLAQKLGDACLDIEGMNAARTAATRPVNLWHSWTEPNGIPMFTHHMDGKSR